MFERVRVGRSIFSGNRGLITVRDGVMVWPFRLDKFHSMNNDVEWDSLTPAQQRAYCHFLGFELIVDSGK